MKRSITERLMQGTSTKEGKITAVLLAFCLALMAWDVNGIIGLRAYAESTFASVQSADQDDAQANVQVDDSTTSVTYHVSAPGDYDITYVDKVPVGSYVLKSPADLNYESPSDDYTFEGWATSPDSEAAFQIGNTITVDDQPAGETSKNNLYAVWKAVQAPAAEELEDSDSRGSEDPQKDVTEVTDPTNESNSSSSASQPSSDKPGEGKSADPAAATDPENTDDTDKPESSESTTDADVNKNEQKAEPNATNDDEVDPNKVSTDPTDKNTDDLILQDTDEQKQPITPGSSEDIEQGKDQPAKDAYKPADETEDEQQEKEAEEETPAPVDRVTINVRTVDVEKLYGDPDPAFPIIITDENGTEIAESDLGMTLEYTIERDPGEDVNIYSINVTGPEVQGNYLVNFSKERYEGCLSIKKLSAANVIATFGVTDPNGATIASVKQNGYDAFTMPYAGKAPSASARIAKKGEGSESMIASNTNDFTYRAYDAEANVASGDEQEGLPSAVGTYLVRATWKDVGFIDDYSRDFILNITPRKVTLTSASATRIFTGAPLTSDSVSVSGDGFLEGDEFDLHATGTVTAPKTVKNTIMYKALGQASADNYEFELQEGTLTVTSRDASTRLPVTIQAASTSAVYDGTTHEVSGFVRGGVKANGQQVATFAYNGSEFEVNGEKFQAVGEGKDVGPYENEVKGTETAHVYTTDGTDVTDQFDLTFSNGSLTITKCEVTIETESAEKVFDGTPLTSTKVKQEGWAEGEGADITVTGKQTQVGRSQNTVEYKLKEGTNADNYTITVKTGTLEVTPADAEKRTTITIGAVDQEANFTGGTLKPQATLVGAQAWKWNDAEQAAKLGANEEGLVEGIEVYVGPDLHFVTGLTAVPIEVQGAGTYEDAIAITGEPRVWNTQQQDVTDLFVVEYQPATFTVNPVYYTVVTGSASKTYDGSPLTNGDVELKFYTKAADGSYEDAEVDPSFVADHVVGGKLVTTGSITQVGTAPNTFSPLVPEAQAEAEEATEVEEADEANETDETDEAEAAKEEVYVPTPGTVQFLADEGKSLMPLDFDLGTLEVKPVDTADEGAAAGFSAVASDVVYNGTQQMQQPTITYSLNGEETTLVAGEDYTVSFKGARGNLVDAQTVTFTAALTGNYKGQVTGTYQITPCAYGVVTGSATKAYDGTALRASEAYARTSAEGTGLAGRDVVTVTASGSQQAVGESQNGYSIQWGSVKQGNYVHDDRLDNLGTLTVTALDLSTLTVKADDVVYNGQEQVPATLRFYQRTSDDASDTSSQGDEVKLNPGWYEVQYASNRNAGDASITVTPTQAAGDNYTGTAAGSFTIKPLAITLKSATATQQYNTKPFTKKVVQILDASGSEVRMPAGEEIDFEVTGSQTFVGSSDNTFTWSWHAEDTSDFVKNYTIAEEVGTLTVTPVATPIPVKVLAASDKVVYDGKTHEVSGLASDKLTVGNGPELEIVLKDAKTVSAVDADTYENTVDAGNITLIQDGQDVTESFSIEVVPGSLVIEPRAITLKSEDLQREYDGSRLASRDGGSVTATVTSEGADGDAWVVRTVDGESVQEGVDITMTGGLINVGTTPNTFTYEFNANTNPANYAVTTDFGTIEVLARGEEKVHLTVRAADVAIDYDGQLHDAQSLVSLEGAGRSGVSVEAPNGSVYTVRGLKAQVTGLPVNADGAELPIVDVTAKPYTVNVVIDSSASANGQPQVFDTEGNDVSDQFAIDFQSGTLTVNPLVYAVTTESIQRSYSGEPIQGGEPQVSITTVNGEEVANGQAIMKADFVDESSWFATDKALDIISSISNTYTKPAFKAGKDANYVHGSDLLGVLTLTRASFSELTEQGTPRFQVRVTGDAVYNAQEQRPAFAVVDLIDPANPVAVPASAYTAAYEGDTLNAGEAEVRVTATSESLYEGQVTGTFTIQPAPYGIATPSASKSYDGKPLMATQGGYLVGLKGVDSATVNLTAQVTIGYQDNFASPEDVVWTSGNASNYVYDSSMNKIGSLNVTKADFSELLDPANPASGNRFVVEADEATYNGLPQETLTGVRDLKTDTLIGLTDGVYIPEGEDATVTYSNNVNASRNAQVTVKAVADNQFYRGSIDGTFRVNQRYVTITTGSAEQYYDTTELRNESVTVGGDGFATYPGPDGVTIDEADGVSYVFTGSQTTPGSSQNWCNINFDENITKSSNYNLVGEAGWLTVLSRVGETADMQPIPLKIKANSERVVYDGEYHEVTGYEAQFADIVDDSKLTIEGVESGSVAQKEAGTYTASVRMSSTFAIMQDDVNVKDQFKVDFESGQLVIAKRTVNLKSEDLEREYNGRVLQSDVNDPNAIQITGDGWAPGEGATYTFHAARTNPGESINEFSYELMKGTDEDNYNISVEFGKLYVSKEGATVLEVVVSSGEAYYNGTELSYDARFEGADGDVVHIQDGNETLTLSNAYIPAVHATDVAIDEDGNIASYPVYGTLEGEDAQITNEAGEDVSANYIVRFIPGTFTILPIVYNVSTEGGVFEYDGNPHANTGVTIDKALTTPFRNDVVSYSTKYTFIDITNGVRDNEYEIIFQEGKAQNYRVGEEKIGKVTITKADMSDGRVIVDIPNVAYTGLQSQPQIVVLDEKTHAQVRSDQFDFQFVGDLVNVTEGGVQVIVTPGPNCNYTGSASGSYKITQAPYSIVTGSASKTYDGEALTAYNDAQVVGLQNGETASIKATASIVLGSIANTTGGEESIQWGTANKANYYYDQKNDSIGTLTVTKANLDEALDASDPEGAKRFTLVLTEENPKYDGTEHELLQYVYDARTKQPLDTALYEVAYADNKNAGTATVTVVMKNQDDDNTGIVGELEKQVTIAKRTVVLTAESASRPYNGQELVRPDVKVSGDGFVEGEVTNVYAEADSQRVLYTYDTEPPMVNQAKFTYVPEKFNWNNYDITYQHGTLVITQAIGGRDFIGTVDAPSKTYDATPVDMTFGMEALEQGAQPDYYDPTVDYYQIVNGEDVYLGSGSDYAPTNAGSYRAEVIWWGTSNVTETSKSVKFDIRPHAITIESASASKTDDGKALVSKEVTVKGIDDIEAGWIGNDGEGFTYEVTGSQTGVGASKNTFTYSIPESVNLDNYKITKVEGQLVVYSETASGQTVNIEGASTTFVYDGKEHVVDTITPSSVTVEGVEYVIQGVTAYAAATDVTGPEGKPVVLEGEPRLVIRGTNTDMTDYFQGITMKAGKLIVNPAPVTVTTPGAEKAFDGTPLTANEGTTVEGYYNGDVASYKATGSVTAVTSDEGVDNTYELVWKTPEAAKNYTIQENLGKLKITPATVSDDDITTDPADTSKRFVVTQPQDVKYNGQTQKQAVSVIDNTNPSGTLLQGRDFTVAYTSSNESDAQIKNAGTITAKVTLQGNYTGEVERTYTIQKRTVSLTSETAEKTYDGSRLYRSTVTQKGDGLVANEIATLRATGSVTNVVEGQVTNTIVFTGNANYNENNYDWQGITQGTLKINPRVITLVSQNRSKSYDGTPLVAGGYVTVPQAAGWVNSSDIPAYNFSGERTLVGTTSEGNVFSYQNSAALQNYSITKQYGSLSVIDNGITALNSVVKKTHEGGKTYGLGDTVTFDVVVTNIYDTAKNITLSERTAATFSQVAGGTLSDNGSTIEFANVPAGQTRSVKATYKILEADILAQAYTNTVSVSYGKGELVRNSDVVTAAEIQDAAPAVAISKADANTTSNPIYNTGDGIVYRVNVTNTGNLTLRNIRVADPLTNDTWNINALTPGQTRTFATGTYRVVSSDIVAGRVRNTAQVTGATVPTAPAGAPAVAQLALPVNSNTVVSNVAVAGPAISLSKAAFAEDGTEITNATRVAKGDTVNYVITVTNNGNVALSNLAVNDEQAGFSTTADAIEPATTQTFNATHVIDEADILAGTYTNTATVSANTPDDATLTASDSATVTTEAPTSNVSVTKTVANAPENGEYAIGDQIKYQIAVTNEGNVAANDVVVSDVLRNATGAIQIDEAAGGQVDGNKVTFDSIASGETRTIEATYTLQEADQGKAISNSALASGSGNSTNAKSDVVAASAQKTYRLTVNFKYADGSDAAPSVTGRYAQDATYSVDVPQIDGFTATASDGSPISGALVGTMPARNLTVSVIYVADSAIDAATTPADNPTAGPAAGPAGAPAAGVTPAAAAAGANGIDAATAAVAQQAANGAQPSNATVQIDDEGNPLVQTISDDQNPLASGVAGPLTWSPIDIVFALVTLALALLALIRTSGSRREEEEEQGKRSRGLAIATLIPAVAAVALVLATQDFATIAVAVDNWTPLFAGLAAANAALLVLSGAVSIKKTPAATA